MFEKIMMYVDMGIWVLILFGILISYARGFKRTFNNFCAVLLTIAFCYFLSPIISKAIASVDISFITHQESMSLIELIKNSLSENLGITVDAGSKIDQAITSVSVAILNIPVFFTLFFFSIFTIRYLFRLIFLLIPLSKTKTFISRVMASFLHLVTMTVVSVIGFSLVFGALGLVEDVREYAGLENNSEVVDVDFSEVKDAIDTIEAQPFFKYISFISGHNYKIEQWFLGKLTTIKIDGAKINFVKEKDYFLPLAPLVENMVQEEDVKTNISNCLENKDLIITSLKKSTIFEFVMPLVVEVLEQKEAVEGLDYNALQAINWRDEKNNFLDILSDLCEIIDDSSFDLDNPQAILKNPNLPLILEKIAKKINQSDLVKSTLIPLVDGVLQDQLDEILPSEFQELKPILKLANLDLEQDLKNMGYIINDLAIIGLFDGEEVQYIHHKEQVIDIIDHIFNLSLIDGNEEKIFTSIIAYTKVNDKLAEYNISILPEKVTDWHQEMNIIKNIITNVFDILADDAIDLNNMDQSAIIDLLTTSSNINAILEDLCDSMMLKDSIIPLLDKILSDANLNEFESDYFVNVLSGIEEIDSILLKEDLHNIIQIINDAKALDLANLDFNELSDDDIDTLAELLLKVNALNLLKIDKLIDYINDLLHSMDFVTQVLPMYDFNNDGSSKDEWAVEIPRLIDVIKTIKQIDFNNNTLEESSEELGQALDIMKDSYLFGNDTQASPLPYDDIFNQFMVEALIKLNLVGVNSLIGLDEANNTNWHDFNYSEEFAILQNYDTNRSPLEQSDEAISAIQSSQIIRTFFDIASFINQKIEGISFSPTPLINITLSDYINGGEVLTNEELYERNWADELSDINELLDVFNANTSTEFKEGIENLANSANSTIASDAANSIKNTLQNSILGNSNLWDLM